MISFKEYFSLQENVLGIKPEEFFNNIKNRTFIFFDTETTGLKPYGPYRQITQMAAIAINSETGEELDTFDEVLTLNKETHTRIEKERQNPPTDPKDKTIDDLLKMSGYQPEKANKSPLEAGEDFIKWTSKFNNPLIIIQNASFDMTFLNTLMKHNRLRIQVWDILKFNRVYLEPILNNLVKNNVPEAIEKIKLLKHIKTGKISYAQDYLGKAFGVDTKGAHVALHDVEQLIGVVKNILDFIKRNTPKLDPLTSKKDFESAYITNNRKNKSVESMKKRRKKRRIWRRIKRKQQSKNIGGGEGNRTLS